MQTGFEDRRHRFVIHLAVMGWVIVVAPGVQAQLTPERLRCEHLANPLGIDVIEPRLSWQLKSRVEERGQHQTAWRVLVASSREKLERDEGDLWDSGKVESGQSILVPYGGTPLQSRQRCCWKVMAWDAQGRPGPWSAPAFWEMALLQPSDWQARWIASSAEEASPPPLEPAPMFRREFAVTREVRRARAYVTGLGYFELLVNGRKVGDHALDPVTSRYDRRVYYLTFDIADQLQRGDNAVGVMLGTGWFNMHTKAVWGFGQAPWRARPRMLCQIEIEYADGSVQQVGSDSSWKVSSGPVVFDGIRNGETHDARLERLSWDRPGYDDTKWRLPAEVSGPGGVLSAQMLPPIRATRTLRPKSVHEVQPGVWVYDFDQNLAGRLQLSVAAPAGTRISLKQGERLYPDGTVQQKEIARFIRSGELQTDTYICKGEGLEVWEPRFIYHGFQYVEVRGLPRAPTLDLLRAKVLHTDFASAGSFSCSKELFNRIQECTRWSFIGNYHGIPTDCPHREKIGWTGDAHLVGETGLFNYDMAASYTKWLRDFADEQRDDGDLPGIVPTSGWGYQYGAKGPYRDLGYGPQWEGAYVILSWYVHLYTGDTRILRDHYAGFCRYLDHLTRHAEDGLIRFGIDDHAPARTHTPPEEFAAGFYYQIAQIVSQAATILGRSEDAQRYAQLAESIRTAYNRHLLDRETGLYASGSQTAQSAPLYFGIVEPEQRERVLARLVANVQEHDNHLDAGVVGTKFLMNGLAQHGRADVAYRIVSQTTFPSWGDWMRKGANTLWQKWDDSMSRNHIMFGDVSAWMFKYIGGLQPDPAAPGFKHFFVHPQFFPNLTWVTVEHESPYGLIRCAWRRDNDRLELTLTVPVNSSATLRLPAPGNRILEGGVPLSEGNGIERIENQSEDAAIQLGSGDYRFTLPEPRTLQRQESASAPNVVTILKADPDTLAGRPGNGFRIACRWQAVPMDKDYTVFLHVLDEEGKVVLQDDHEPPMPTSRWNGPVAYTRTVPLEKWQVKDKQTIDVALAEGRYPICVGLYDKKEGRKALLHAGPGVTALHEGQYRIGTLIVDARAPIPGPGEKTLDLTDYHLTFDEEFDDLSVCAWGPAGPKGTRWIAHTPWHGDFGDARFTDPRPGFPFTVQDGLLRIEARQEGGRWRSGLLSAVDPNGNGFKQQYGYFECRAKFPQGPGTWPAFWLMGLKSLRGLPGNTGPRINPEIDVVEHYGHWPWRYHYVLHQWGRGGAQSQHDGKRFVVFGMEEDFHTYGVMIDEEHIILYFDGVELYRERTPESVKTPLFPLVNLALGSGWPTDKTPNPSYLYVDYVKVWQKRNAEGG